MALPISNAPKNYHWIYKIFQDFALRSKDLKGHYGFGGIDEINSEVLEYPYMWVEPVRTRVITSNRDVKSGYSTIECEVRVIVADKLRSDLLNTPETISDVNEIVMTTVAELSQHPYYALNNVKLVEDVIIETEIEKNDDIVNRAIATFVLQYPFKYTYCSDPVLDVDGYLSISDMFLTVTASFCELVHDCIESAGFDRYTTTASLVDNIAVFERNDGVTYSLDLSGFSSGTPSLSGLSDVLIVATPSNGDSLVYNSSIDKWEPGISSVNYDRLFDYTGTYSYSGTAPQGSLITDPLWDITRIEYFGSGTGSISTSTQSVPWVDRYIVTYV